MPFIAAGGLSVDACYGKAFQTIKFSGVYLFGARGIVAGARDGTLKQPSASLHNIVRSFLHYYFF